MKRIIFIILVLVLAMQSKADELLSGTFRKLGLNYAYLTHSAGKSHIDSLHIALNYESYSIYKNGFVLGGDFVFGGSTGNINKYYPLEGAENLTSYKPPVGNANIFLDGSLYLGYTLVRRNADMPLYIGTGYKITNFASGSGNAPAVGNIGASYIPIELRGNVRMHSKFYLEYLFAYDIGLDQLVIIEYDEDKKTQVSAKNGYGLRLSLGGRYYVGKKMSFYANILASYHSFGASESATISITQPPAGTPITPGYIAGASTIVSYPRSSISYVGLRFGIGF